MRKSYIIIDVFNKLAIIVTTGRRQCSLWATFGNIDYDQHNIGRQKWIDVASKYHTVEMRKLTAYE